MQHTAVFEEQVTITPRDMRNKIDSIEDLVRDKLKARLEGRCSRHGFVIPDTMKVLSRSMGSLEKGRFTGSIIFHVQAEGNVLNPPDGIIIEGEVIRKNKMGIYVSYQDAIRVIIPRDLHVGDEAFELVEIGEKVEVEVKKSRFQVNDPYILSVGTFRASKGKGKGNAVEPIKELKEPVFEEEQGGEEQGAEEEGGEEEGAEEEGAEEEGAEEEDIGGELAEELEQAA